MLRTIGTLRCEQSQNFTTSPLPGIESILIYSEILGLLATEAPYCPKHSVKMICPKCVASSGGRRTTTKYRDRLSSWGKMGGRGKRKGFSLCPASTASDFARTLEQSSRKRKAAR